MQKIVPHLWFDKQAKEVAEFYSLVFPNSQVNYNYLLSGTPVGDCDVVSFSIMGYEFLAISAGPDFKINPAISFMVNFDPSQDENAKMRIDEVWVKLSNGGKVLMPLDKYPFSERYGWVEDKFGVSWQLIYTNPEGEERPLVIPAMLFVNDKCGKAEEATEFYMSVFKNSKRGALVKYPAGSEPNKEGSVMFTDFKLEGQWFVAMDGGGKHEFNFNEGVSFVVNCETQEEIDYYWEKLSAVPEAEQCGWLKDKYGVSWQVTPANMEEMFRSGSKEQIERMTKAFLDMKKINMEVISKAGNKFVSTKRF